MIFLLNFFDEFEIVLPFIMVIVFFAVIMAVVIATAVKNAKSQQRQKTINDEQARYTDGNGRTEQQNEYLRRLRSRQAEISVKQRDMQHQSRIAQSAEHAHSGAAEHYEPIVGSLGEVSDEGCGELDGVRLVNHDEAYCDDSAHMDIADYSELQKAIVIGEAVNNPRFKTPACKK